MLYLSNAFSIQMLNDNSNLSFKKISVVKVREITHESINYGLFKGCIGHADTANVVANELGISLNLNNRVSIKLTEKDDLIVAQLTGGRLPEGATTLPEGFKIEYWLVSDNNYSIDYD